jgi:hypothetical protein
MGETGLYTELGKSRTMRLVQDRVSARFDEPLNDAETFVGVDEQ